MNSESAAIRASFFCIMPFCLAVLFLFLARYIFPEQTLQDWWWGGLHAWKFPLLPLAFQVLAPLSPLIVLLLPAEVFVEARTAIFQVGRKFAPLIRNPSVGLLAVIPVLWLFRSVSLMFGDSIFYVTDVIPTQAFSDRGLIIMYDSIGTTWMYSWGFRFAKSWFSMDPLVWYNAVGILSLLLFFVWIYTARFRERTLATPLALLLLFAGNWSQATLGAPEHYVQLLLCCLAFAILAIDCLDGRTQLWKPCLAYSIGAFFHLGIAWIFPALVYLVYTKWKSETREGQTLAVISMFLPAVLTGSFAYTMGFDFSFMSQSNAAKGKLIPFLSPDHPYSGRYYKYATFDLQHIAHIAQEILLMGWPGIVLLAGVFPHVSLLDEFKDPRMKFLTILFGGTLLFNFLWNPDLEFWRDQDLFCIIGLAVCLLGVYTILGPAGQRLSPGVRTRIIAAAIVGGLSWRVAVVLYHSVLALNYANPSNTGAYWPFAL